MIDNCKSPNQSFERWNASNIHGTARHPDRNTSGVHTGTSERKRRKSETIARKHPYNNLEILHLNNNCFHA